MGDPRLAIAAKGWRYFDLSCEQISEHLVQLAACDPATIYQNN